MEIRTLTGMLEELGVDFCAGVPDSFLQPLVDTIIGQWGVGSRHVVAANEGAAVALAAGHALATGRPAMVYMQNSGIGNAVNPICSLLHADVYRLPLLFCVGWRGEPDTRDEPQHVFQGRITLPLLRCLEVVPIVVARETADTDVPRIVSAIRAAWAEGRSAALVIRKGALTGAAARAYENDAPMTREDALSFVVKRLAPEDVCVSTTGKLSRELFELRERRGEGHARDFLTVGSMGHSIMIALGVALAKPARRVVCLDGDGAALMHLGSLPVAASLSPRNLVHIVFNNGAHESVGGVPTAAGALSLADIAIAAGYSAARRARTEAELAGALAETLAADGPAFLEIRVNLASRANLGRPTTTPLENKCAFMENLQAE